MNIPGVGTVLVDSNTGLLAVGSAEPNVQWDTGCVSWHTATGEYRIHADDAPNFLAASGARLSLDTAGCFQNKGARTPNFVNSNGFAAVLAPQGALKEFVVTDVNGVRVPVNKHGIISERYDRRPLPRDAKWTPSGVDLRYRVMDGSRTLIATAIVGSLCNPVFLSNGDLPNLITMSKDSTSTTFYYVQGFPYVKLGKWVYADRGGGPVRLRMVAGEVDYRRAYAVRGKLVGMQPRPAIWSDACSKYGIMQVGPTCQSATCLNLLLCCTVLRQYCVKCINGYMVREGLGGLAGMGRWKESHILTSDSFTETVLHAVFKRLCGKDVTTPDTISLTTVCLREQTYGSSMYCGQSEKHVQNVLIIDYLQALGLDAGLLHPPLSRVIPAEYDYAIRATGGADMVALSLHNFVLVGSFILVSFGKFEKAGEEELGSGAHAIAGVICEGGKRVLFDSNFGEVAVDWALDPDAVKQHVLRKYASVIGTFVQYALYFSKTFMDAHTVPVPCMSLAERDVVHVVPMPRSARRLCTLADTLVRRRGEPFSIAGGEAVDVSGWPKCPLTTPRR